MKLVNVTLPKRLEEKMERNIQESYTSTGEFVRTSIVRLLTKHQILPQSAKIDLLRKKAQLRMKQRKEVFNAEKELQELKKIRNARRP